MRISKTLKSCLEIVAARLNIFVTTKLWNNYHRKEHAVPMAKGQIESWGLGYIDLFLNSFPLCPKVCFTKDKALPGE
jgi:D-xylose reductase